MSAADNGDPPLYRNPTEWRLDALERRVTAMEHGEARKEELLARMDERQQAMQRETAERFSGMERSLRNLTRVFYATGVLILSAALTLIGDLITRG